MRFAAGLDLRALLAEPDRISGVIRRQERSYMSDIATPPSTHSVLLGFENDERVDITHWTLMGPVPCLPKSPFRATKSARGNLKGYLTILSATAEQTIQAPPFDAIEIRVGDRFGDDED